LQHGESKKENWESNRQLAKALPKSVEKITSSKYREIVEI
jgi:hypothetical protein